MIQKKSKESNIFPIILLKEFPGPVPIKAL